MKSAGTLLVLLVLCAAAAAWVFGGMPGREAILATPPPSTNVAAQRGSGSGPTRAIAVEVAEARAARTSTDIRAIGSLQSDETVQLAPEIAGRVSEIDFVEGTKVKAGDVLVRLDDALVRAEVTDAEARLSFAEANNERARQLSRTGNVTERSRDEALTNFETARAALELAKTRLDKHLLRAPFDGIAGVRNVSVGAFVAVGTPVVNIEKIDGLKVDFKVPEIYLTSISVGQVVDVTVDALPGRTFAGKIYAVNPLIDVNGRALQVRARLDNEDLVLRPGLFARILIKGAVQRDVVVVPESAILPRAGDNFVFRVSDGKAQEVGVKLGERSDATVEITEGVTPGDLVVTAGQHKLRDGATVEVVASHPHSDQSAQRASEGSGG
ncbi:MAG: efflux RND transporter periplasmic adaptor subunit [Hyphomicrobium sp.]|nr:efflux RND transporter periplasmic adaptor subunit [Hyphomicrobium sp.]